MIPMTLSTFLLYAIPLALALAALRAWDRWSRRPYGPRRYYPLYTEEF